MSFGAVPGSASGEAELWELFHENSKTNAYEPMLPGHEIVGRMLEMEESFDYRHCPQIELPADLSPLNLGLAEAIVHRSTARALSARTVTLQDLGTILELAYGVTRDNADTPFPRPFRVVPSGGALYPLELYLHTTRLDGQAPGLYHYNPVKRALEHMRYGDESRQIADGLVQRELALDSSVVIFITAVLQRTTFKYGNRGYRFALIEAGHVSQNINLVTTALGLGSVNIGGYFDRRMDRLLGIDGIEHTTVYMCAIGDPTEGGGGFADMP